MNRLLGTKISIATPKPQTTRHQIIGIHSDENSQIIFLDTPGILTPGYELQSAMMRFVERAKKDADIILLIVDPADAKPEPMVAEILNNISVPLLLVINKMDTTDPQRAKMVAEPIITNYNIHSVHYISALKGDGVTELLGILKELTPEGPPWYPKEMLSEHPMRFFASELVREQLFLLFHEEIPYSCTVEVIQYSEKEEMDVITAEIIVNRKSQKGMLIGKGGRAIKELGIRAREAIEEFTERKVYLDLHVKVREKWREKEDWVRNLGYK